MRKILFFAVFLIITEGVLLAEENIVAFHVAYKNAKPNTRVVIDSDVGKIYVRNKPILVTSDIEKARVHVDRTKPPEWLNSAVKSSGSTIPQPQIKISLTLNKQGKDKFSKTTADNIGNRIAIFINDQLFMAPQVVERIDSYEVLVTAASLTEAQTIVDRINGKER
jgi:preprotein translocase subunit SecD